MTTPDTLCPALTFATAPEWVRLETACALAGDISQRTMRRWIAAGLVRATKPSPAILLISTESLRLLMERSVVNPRWQHIIR